MFQRFHGCGLARGLAVVVAGVYLTPSAEAQTPVGTAFTYSAQLKQNGIPLNGTLDIELSLFDSEDGGTPLSNQSFTDVEAVNGHFGVEVDFGSSAFPGDARWIEAAIRAPHDPDDLAPFTTLAPRQRISSVPYATHALNAEDRHSLDSSAGGPSDAVVVDQNGNVGIGTTTPRGRLHVVGGPPGQPVTFVDQAQHQFGLGECTPQQQFTAGADGRLMQVRVKLFEDLAPTNETLSIYVSTKLGPVLIAEVSGVLQGVRYDEIGLSFSTATAPQLVVGSEYLFQYAPRFFVCGTGSSNAYPGGEGDCRGGLGDLAGDLWFETVVRVNSPGEDVVIDSAGRLGIGTLEPAGKLHVENGPNVLDQSQHGEELSIQRIGTFWQSFRAGTNGRLSRIQVKLSEFQSPSLVTLRIYEGDGTAGSLLAEAPDLPFAGDVGDIVVFDMPAASAPAIRAGSTYTFEGVFPPLTALFAQRGNPYPEGSLGGRSDDLWFETYVTGPVSGLVFAANGNLGVGTATPQCKLSVVGPACADSFVELSDARLKLNVEPLTGALDILSELTGVRFDWRGAALGERPLPEGRQLGFIAQEVEKVLPEVVVRDAEGYYAIDYGRLTPVLVSALHELKTQADAERAELECRLEGVEAQNLRLQRRLDALEARSGIEVGASAPR